MRLLFKNSQQFASGELKSEKKNFWLEIKEKSRETRGG